ncbi:MAG: SCO family protein [Chloroflexota bacterium]
MAEQPINKTPNSNSRMLMLGTIVVAVVGAAIILFALFSRGNKPVSNQADGGAAIVEGDTFTGVQPVEPPRQLQAWTLTSQDNKPFSLSDLKGKMALILFGYTHCPDVCPTTLLEYKTIKAALGNQGSQVNFVFISIDGARDTPAVVKTYVDKFDSSFIGLTGDEATLKRLGGDYDLYFAKSADASGSTENYLMDHNSNTYLVDQDGKLVALYIYGTETDVITQDIQARLST